MQRAMNAMVARAQMMPKTIATYSTILILVPNATPHQPVDLAARYYTEGADEITFLNITGFRDFPLEDMPMLKVLKETSRTVFVPLTIGGGIRDYVDKTGRNYSALEVAAEYFRSGADKISDACHISI